MNELLERVSNYGIVPVVKISRVEDALPLAKALCKGGLSVAEITFRTSCAEEAIRAIHKEFPDMLLGAGTVLTPEQADKAVAAGACFIVSPGLNPRVVEHCLKKGYPVIPGTATPSDLEKAIELGLTAVKFFPAEANGGIKSIKAMSAPYGNLKFMPTGGINEKNLNDYMSFPKIFACGGSWMVAADMIENGQFDRITEMTRAAVNVLLDLKLAHIGINSAGEAEAERTANALSALTSVPKDEKSMSVFVGSVEVMKQNGAGSKGHIGYSTPDVARAKFHLEQRGFVFDEGTAKYTPEGRLKFIYLKDEIGGFAAVSYTHRWKRGMEPISMRIF